MSPPPWRFRQVELLPPPGMNQTTAPGVTFPGQAIPLPVVGSTQWPSLARSPRDGVPAGGLALGRPAATGTDWNSGAGAPLLSRGAPEFRAQPFNVPPLI